MRLYVCERLFHMDTQTLKARIAHLFREYIVLESRPSHLIIGGMIVVGAIINCFFAHGWTVWPFVLAFGMLTYINEAVDRNGQGIPPIQVYGFFVAVGLVWIVLILLMWSINPLIMILGVGVILYRVVEAFMRQRERERLIATRIAEGVCLHCGEVYDPNASVCPSCWEEPNPDVALLRRVALICRSPQEMARAERAGPGQGAGRVGLVQGGRAGRPASRQKDRRCPAAQSRQGRPAKVAEESAIGFGSANRRFVSYQICPGDDEEDADPIRGLQFLSFEKEDGQHNRQRHAQLIQRGHL